MNIDQQDCTASVPVPAEHVVLVDRWGQPRSTVPKRDAHHRATEMHLAFSCHVVRADGAVLLTRRARSKATWPGWWTNGCCGHPQVGETLRQAVCRRVREELGVGPTDLGVAISDFTYRATMPDGTSEHELCPVLVVRIDGPLRADPGEVDDVKWVTWAAVVDRAHHAPETLTPWCAEQVRQLDAAGVSPANWLQQPTPASAVGLDTRIEMPSRPSGTASAQELPEASDAPHPQAMDVVLRPLAVVLDQFLVDKARELTSVDPELSAMVEEIRALVDAGGKRLRPALAYWGHRATGADHDPAVIIPAAAIELLHTFALVHDDVMDRSVNRRGRPSAFVAMADRHRSSGGLGDSDWFGVSAAMLIGDLAFVWADELFDACPMDAGSMVRARRIFTRLRSEVIAGQYLDLSMASDSDAAEERARKVALLKSARYTVTRPLLLGASLGPTDGHARVQSALAAYGDAVGLAFQMRDDVLGVFGDPTATGKGCLDDLREGKRTLLALRALRLARPAGRMLLHRCLGDPLLDDVDAERCREVIAESGALASVEALLAGQHEIGLAALARLDDPARTALEQLAASAIVRHA